ncbi:hypothetical protein GUH47_29060, partial [Xanthomonas citri pv. citri]|nr:hypothetical protein [Xanthomonas citri pv. citri]
MDELDRASELEARERDFGVQAAQRAATDQKTTRRSLLPVGSCYYCDSAVNANHLFCDQDCAEDYAAEEAAKVR